MIEYKIKYIERQLKEKESWESKLTSALTQENYLLCALYRDKIKTIEEKINKAMNVQSKDPL